MARKILAFFAGLITFLVVTTIVQLISGAIYGMPSMEMMSDPQAMADHIARLPSGAFVFLAASYIIGSTAAGFLMHKISRWNSLVLPLLIGLIGTIFWAVNSTTYPHPMWMNVLGYFCFIPFTVLGHRMAKL